MPTKKNRGDPTDSANTRSYNEWRKQKARFDDGPEERKKKALEAKRLRDAQEENKQYKSRKRRAGS